MSCNAAKTVCMVFQPVRKSRLIADDFPNFFINGHALLFAREFCYLGHIINIQFTDDDDDDDIRREIWPYIVCSCVQFY